MGVCRNCMMHLFSPHQAGFRTFRNRFLVFCSCGEQIDFPEAVILIVHGVHAVNQGFLIWHRQSSRDKMLFVCR